MVAVLYSVTEPDNTSFTAYFKAFRPKMLVNRMYVGVRSQSSDMMLQNSNGVAFTVLGEDYAGIRFTEISLILVAQPLL